MPDDIRALTVRMPWASAIAFSCKTVENRTWATRWRGTVLIHTGKTADRHTVFDLNEVRWGRIRGAVIAVARLADCHADDGACTPWAEHGAFHWVLADVRPLIFPVMCPGRLGLWRPGPDVLAEVSGQIGALA